MPFKIAHLLHLLEQITPVERLWVGFSGGIDSRVLLHQVNAFRDQLPTLAGAIHVHHGLSPHADEWSAFCQSTCDDYAIECQQILVDATAGPGESPEQAAREARYLAFQEFIGAGDVLLLAHHQDDQAETFLYQAIRGAGPHGLSAMPEIRPFSQGYLVRPLLNVSRQDIEGFARQHQLEWMNDESNDNIDLDRNFLRQVIFPQLRERWPSVSRTLSRSARHTASLTSVVDKMLDDVLKDIQGMHTNTLSISKLKSFSKEYSALLVRAWIRHLGLPVPAAHHIRELFESQLVAAPDRQAVVQWSDVEVRRYQDDLYFLRPLDEIQQSGWRYEWQVNRTCEIPELQGRLSATPIRGQGLAAKFCDQGLLVKPRSGGEKCQPVSRDHHTDLKKLYQEAQIPPWERVRLPLIYVGEHLAAVADQWVCREFSATGEEPGYLIDWHTS